MDDFFGPTDPTEEEPLPEAGRTPERDRPARTKSSGSADEKRTLMIRRGMALGAGILVLLLIVVGINGCLDARKNRSLEDYSNSVTQVTDEANTLGADFFETLDSPGDLSVSDFTTEVESDRGAVEAFRGRVDRFDTPGEMSGAQDVLELVYRIRSEAMTDIAGQIPTALGDEGSEEAVEQIATQIQALVATDVLFNRIVRGEISGVLSERGVSAAKTPLSSFVPDPAKWSDPAEVSSALTAVGGGPREADDDAIHGTGIADVSIGGEVLSDSVSTVIPTGTEPVVEVSVQNQGETEESDIEVSVSVDGGTALTQTIDTLGIGETGTASITLTPPPSGEVTLEIEVSAVPGEGLLDNNQGSYTVSFE
jgi:hypothetical protein